MAANRPYSPYEQGCTAMDRADGLFFRRCQGWAWTSKDSHCDAHHKRRDGLTASNVNTRKGNATELPYRLGSNGKSWIDPTFHTVDGRRRGR